MYNHPEERHLTTKIDILLKIADILYFYKSGKADLSKTKKRLSFLKPIVKRKWPEEFEELYKEIDKAKEMLEKYDKEAYDKWIEYLKENHPEAIKKLEAETKSSLLAFFQ